MTRVFVASTAADLLLLAAGVDAAMFGDRGERQVLLASDDAVEPEVVAGIAELEALAGLRARFDEVVVWNDVIAPLHPAAWQPPAAELPLLSRLVVGSLGLADGVSELVLPAGGDGPATAVAQLLRDAPITGYVADLAGYGPPRRALPATRVERSVYLDLVGGLVPPSLRDYDGSAASLPPSAVGEVLAELPAPEPGDAAGIPAILGPDPAAPSVGLPARALRALAARGERRVVFRPHPASVWSPPTDLRDEATALGVELLVIDDGLPHEAWFAAARPSLVVAGVVDSALVTAPGYGCDVATVEAEHELDALTPYENSARIAATIVAATVPELGADGTLTPPARVDLPALVDAVAYCMQPNRLPGLRDTAAAYLTEHGPDRYFKRKRVYALNLLPEPEPEPPPQPARRRRGWRR